MAKKKESLNPWLIVLTVVLSVIFVFIFFYTGAINFLTGSII